MHMCDAKNVVVTHLLPVLVRSQFGQPTPLPGAEIGGGGVFPLSSRKQDEAVCVVSAFREGKIQRGAPKIGKGKHTIRCSKSCTLRMLESCPLRRQEHC